jgi:hypothetical protein
MTGDAEKRPNKAVKNTLSSNTEIATADRPSSSKLQQSVAAPSQSPTTHVIEPGGIAWTVATGEYAGKRTSVEVGLTLDIDKTDILGWRYVKDNSDIGKRRGPRSARAFVLEQAERELRAGYSGTKTALARKLSVLVKQSFHFSDELTMCPEKVERHITPLWRRLRRDAAR